MTFRKNNLCNFLKYVERTKLNAYASEINETETRDSHKIHAELSSSTKEVRKNFSTDKKPYKCN